MRWVGIGLGLLALNLAAGETIVPLTAAQLERLGVEFAQPQPVNAIPLGEVPAMVTVPPQAEAVLSAPVAGQIEEVKVARGDAVAARQVLVVMHSPELLAKQQRLLEAHQEFKVAKARYERERSLFADGVIAQSRFLETEKSWRQAQVAYAQARAELAALGIAQAAIARLIQTQKLDGRLKLASPLTGAVIAREVTVGQWVDRLAPLLRLTATSTLWLDMEVEAARAERLRPGAPVYVEPPGARGEVFLVGETVDPATQTTLVRARLTELRGLRPGRKVVAALFEPSAEPLLKLPRSALVEQEGAPFVFVRVPEGVKALPVSVKAQTEAEAFLTGIDPKAQVVSQGTAALKAAWLGEAEGEE